LAPKVTLVARLFLKPESPTIRIPSLPVPTVCDHDKVVQPAQLLVTDESNTIGVPA